MAAPRCDAIIVAAGASRRMGGTDKLLATIDGRPLLAHSIAALDGAAEIDALVVVTTDARRRALVAGGWVDGTRTTFVDGGERRHDSVRAGFAALEQVAPDPSGERVLLIHDGARPLVPRSVIADVIAVTERAGAAVPVVPVSDTLKRVIGDRVEATVDRADLVAAQTPQGVRRGLLREALASPAAEDGAWTDEAALLEACKIAVHVVPGDPANLKVTVRDDLDRVADLLAGGGRDGRPTRRTGIGQDSHPFGPGSPLRLGGIEIAAAPALHGHSDGDVALHAVADALLGAAGAGDLGRLFPAGPSTPRGANSRELLAAVVARLAGDGWRPTGLDLTIVAARPRLGQHLELMRDEIAKILGLDVDAVNVKASSGNLDGAEGAGRAISAMAVATVKGPR